MESNRIFKVNSTLYFKNLENSKVDGLYNEIILPLRTEVLRYLDLVDLKDNLDLSNDNIGLCIDYADKEGRMSAKYYLTDGVNKNKIALTIEEERWIHYLSLLILNERL